MANIHILDGLNSFDIIYYINLAHRTDRNEHIINELAKTNISKEKINRIEAVYIEHFGILGCAKSHILALEKFIESKCDTCIIFEDDFMFTEEQNEVNKLIESFLTNIHSYDVFMLSCNLFKYDETNITNIKKIIDGQTLSGYCVTKQFAPKLLYNFKESVNILECHNIKIHDFCFDIYMKRLQPFSNWYCLEPRLGKQMKSYSDIEKVETDYGC